MATRPVSKRINNDSSNNELDELKKQNALLQKQFEELKKMMLDNNQSVKSSPVDNVTYEDDDMEDIHISSDTYVKVMSLCPNLLNLSTEARGRGKMFSFAKFGDVKRILYSDLVHIIENHNEFLYKGIFIILNKNVIRRHGLDEAYEKILTKENIDKVVACNQSDGVNLFKNATEKQQEIIINLLIKKALNNEEVDLNFLDRISRIYGQVTGNLKFSIAEKIESARQLKELLETPVEKKTK